MILQLTSPHHKASSHTPVILYLCTSTAAHIFFVDSFAEIPEPPAATTLVDSTTLPTTTAASATGRATTPAIIENVVGNAGLQGREGNSFDAALNESTSPDGPTDEMGGGGGGRTAVAIVIVVLLLIVLIIVVVVIFFALYVRRGRGENESFNCLKRNRALAALGKFYINA